MSTRLELTRDYAARYRKAQRKKDRGQIITEFMGVTGYKQRKYAIKVLCAFDKTKIVCVDGKTVKLKAKRPTTQGNRKGKPLYDQAAIDCLGKIWAFYWFKCGKYLAPLIRETIDDLAASEPPYPDFHITDDIRRQLLAISPAQIDRRLKPERDKLKIKGISGTKPAKAALIKQIPVRTHYSNAERITPGYCQMDTVHHCGSHDSDEFCLTLTVIDVASGWIFLSALRNKAHTWVINNLKDYVASSPFKLIELHNDRGSEFINHDLVHWARVVWNLLQTVSRSGKKNDNAHAEQANNAFVRNYIGYARFDTDAEFAALAAVYQHLCPLINFFIPNRRILSKTTIGSKTVKNYDKVLKTPYQRLMESPHLTQEQKDTLTAQRALYNPVQLQHNLHKAVNALMATHRALHP